MKLYAPERWNDGQLDVAGPMDVRVPARLRVTLGNAGNGTAALTFAGGASGSVECTYRGGAVASHPTDPADIASGLYFDLDSCSGGASVGSLVSAASFHLHVAAGDSDHEIGATGASVVLGENAITAGQPAAPSFRPTPDFEVSEPYGTLKGTSEVSLDGEFRYTVPIEVPPGRAGLQPSLALQYSSRGGDGPVGVGWALTGFPQIRPCAKTVASEGVARGVHYDEGDAFCLDGRKLLATSGSYGQNGTEYRTELDSFSKIVSHDDLSTAAGHFTVVDRSGQTLVFAHAVMREKYAYVGANELTYDGQRAVAWLLSEIRDLAGNRITFNYFIGGDEHAPSDGPDYLEVLPTDVVYVRDAPDAPETERRVSFVYEGRPDVATEYVRGVRSRRSKRLTTIKTSVGTNAVSELRLNYTASGRTERSLLASIVACDGAQGGVEAICLPAKRFSWNTQGRAAWATYVDAPSPDLSTLHSARSSRVILADLNADGYDDVLYQVKSGASYQERVRFGGTGEFRTLGAPANAASPVAGWDFLGTRPVDVDSDGQAEVLAFAPFGGRMKFQLLRFGAGNTFTALGPQYESQHIDAASPGIIDFVDADGDGRLDMFGGRIMHPTPGPETENVFFARNVNGAAFAPAVDLGYRYCPGASTAPRALDLWREGRGAWVLGKCPLTTEGGVVSFHVPDAAAPVLSTEVNLNVIGGNDFVLADINGDGLRDAVFPYHPDPVSHSSGATLAFRVRFNTGAGFTGPVAMPDVNAGVLASADETSEWEHGIRAVDVDGDGRDDLVKFVGSGANAGIWLFASRGDHFASRRISATPGRPDPAFGWVTSNVGDVDGDGLADIVTVTGSSPGTFRVYKNTDIRADLLNEVAEHPTHHRARPSEKVEYSGTWDNQLQHNAAERAVYPQRALKRGQTVVVRHLIAGDYQRESFHSYRSARADLLGRGFLGFKSHTITDFARSLTTTYNFDNETRDGTFYPYAGRPLTKVESTAANATTSPSTRTKSTSFTYEVRRNAGASGIVDVRPVNTDINEVETVAGTTTVLKHAAILQRWDDYGNETFRRERTDNGSTVETTTAFEHEVNASFLSRWLVSSPRDRWISAAEGSAAARSRHTSYGHLDSGLLRTIAIEPHGDASVRQNVQLTYERGAITRVERTGANAAIRFVDAAYDADGVFPTVLTNPLGHRTRLRFEAGRGALLQQTDPNGAATWYGYDGFGRLRTVRTEGGEGTDYHYSGSHYVELEVLTRRLGGGSTISWFDDEGRPRGDAVQTFSGQWAVTGTVYDVLGRPVRIARPTVASDLPTRPNSSGAAHVLEYDLYDRIVKATTPDLKTITHSYRGRTTTTTDEVGHAVTSLVDPHGRIVRRAETLVGAGTAAATRSTDFVYGPFGVLERVVHSLSGAAQPGPTFTYDVLGRRTALHDPDAGSRTFMYDAFGDLVEERDSLDAPITYVRDALGRVTSRSDAEGTNYYVWDTALNGIGRLAAARSADGILTRVLYDAAGREAQKVVTAPWPSAPAAAEDYTTTTGYDVYGRVATKTLPLHGSALQIAYGYSATGYLTTVAAPAIAANVFRVTAMNSDGFVSEVDTPYVTAPGTADHQSRTYDAATGRLTKIVVPGVINQTYTYEARGLLKSRGDSVGSYSESFTYDEARRIKTASSGAWTRDHTISHAGNIERVRRFAAHSVFEWTSSPPSACGPAYPPHWVCNANGRVGFPQYDANGRERVHQWTSTLPGGGVDTRTIEWTSYDLPKAVKRERTSSTGSFMEGEYARYAYDAFGRRVVQELRTSAGAGAEGPEPDAVTVYIGDALEVRRTSAGIVQQLDIRGPENFVAEAIFDAQGQFQRMRTVTSDHLGSRTVFSGAGQSTVRERTEPFGGRVTNGVPRVPNLYENAGTFFTDRHHDDSLGLIDMRGRVYDPRQRRFLTPDPVSVNAAGSYGLRGGMTGAEADWLASDLDVSGSHTTGTAAGPQLARLGSYASGGEAASSASSDLTAYAEGASGAAPGTAAAAAARPGARPAGAQFSSIVASLSFETANPYTYALNVPTQFADPDGYDPVTAAAVGGVVGGVAGALHYAFTAPTSLSWGEFAVNVSKRAALGAVVGAVAFGGAEALVPGSVTFGLGALPGLTLSAGAGAAPGVGASAGTVARVATAAPAAAPAAGGAVRGGTDAVKALSELGYNANSVGHIFQEKHMLDPLLTKFGSPEAALQAMHGAAQVLTTAGAYQTGSWVTIRVGEIPVSIKGTIIDGVFRISTATMRPF